MNTSPFLDLPTELRLMVYDHLSCTLVSTKIDLRVAYHLLSSITHPSIDGHPFGQDSTVRRWARQTTWRLREMQLDYERPQIDIAIDLSAAARKAIDETDVVYDTLPDSAYGFRTSLSRIQQRRRKWIWFNVATLRQDSNLPNSLDKR